MALFRDLGLSEQFAARLEAEGIREPTPIQAEVFPLVLEGQSVLGFSKTGTGKTLAFLAPLVQRIFGNDEPTPAKGIRLLVLVPTRELASQVAEEFTRLVGKTRKVVVVVGGEAEDRQIEGARDSDALVATPGRLIDLLERRMVNPESLDAIVLDEADRLLDMGFLPDIRRLMTYLPGKRQMLFFSATLHFGVDELSYEFGAECTRVGQPAEDATVEGLDHRVAFVGDDEKLHALAHFLKAQGDKRGIVFSNFRDKAHYVAERLQRLGAKASCLTAQLSQPQRRRILDDFKARKVQVLLASDLAARGIDVEELDFVVNYDLPEDPPTYVHRVGRTARAGRTGQALSFVGFEDAFRLEKIESFLKKPIVRETFASEQLSGSLPRFGPAPAEGAHPRREGGHRREERGERGSRPQGHGGHPKPHGPAHENRSRSAPAAAAPSHAAHSGRPKASHSHRETTKTAKPGFSLWTWFKSLFGAKPKTVARPLKPDAKAAPGSAPSAHSGPRSVSGLGGGGRSGRGGRRRDGGRRRGGRGPSRGPAAT